MPSVHVDKVGEMAIIECAGRFVRTETALKLRDAVTSQDRGPRRSFGPHGNARNRGWRSGRAGAPAEMGS